MPATAADIAAAIRAAAIESVADAAVKARYANARDGLAAPAEGFFDAAAHAQAALAARFAVFGTERRRFVADAQELLWIDPAAAIPLVRLIDPELAVDANHIPARIAIDLEEQTTGFELFG